MAGAVGARAVTRVAAVVAVVAAALVALQYGGLGVARRLGVVSRREPFTALAFAHPNALPSRLAPGSSAHLVVRIANHEGEGRRYRWRLLATGAAGAAGEPAAVTALAHGSERIAAGVTRTFAVEARVPAVKGATRLVLRLASPAEAISLRVAVGKG